MQKKLKHGKSWIKVKVEDVFGVVKEIIPIPKDEIPKAAKADRQIAYDVRAGKPVSG